MIGDNQNAIEKKEHDDTFSVKKVSLFKDKGDGTLERDAFASSSIGTGRKTVTTAGTAVQMSAQVCKRVFIQALANNTDAIAVGDSGVVAAAATHQGKLFYAGQGDWFNVNNLNLLYIDSVVNGEGISFYYEN